MQYICICCQDPRRSTEPNNSEPAKPVAFGYVKPNRRQKPVFGVKIVLLPDPESYGYAYAALVEAANDLNLRSVEQIPEDFLKFAIEHAIKECGGQQPTKGWVFSVPQYYKIEEMQNFRVLIKRAGCLDNIYIHNESNWDAMIQHLYVVHPTNL
ncbi:hypothetical protein sscle_04g033680 [Sclerotinia sclerotiorum 1980 UF-70]|uniref:Uncharacterized protein n=1 Tax=Sclerotinia sclerotiorum (strain ATCC 18683 / 1980 / Ss-1) TaxID=665079 RepID=A0A1D9Q0V2_SCLS1|nr:hypothetical protein sscle_04g033680 [Sclerotinia sclerotiorum 1980 UF-70]